MAKRTNPVKVMFDDRELLDLSRIANDDARCVSDLVHVIVRRYLYGRLGRPVGEAQPIHSAEEFPSGTDFVETRGGAGL